MMKTDQKANYRFAFTAVLLLLLNNISAQISTSKSEIEMSYRNSNDLRDALLPVPKEAIFRMDGYYLWDPSVIKVGKTYHLFASRWPESTGMQGWKKSHNIIPPGNQFTNNIFANISSGTNDLAFNLPFNFPFNFPLFNSVHFSF